jgi:hypothetical protein
LPRIARLSACAATSMRCATRQARTLPHHRRDRCRRRRRPTRTPIRTRTSRRAVLRRRRQARRCHRMSRLRRRISSSSTLAATGPTRCSLTGPPIRSITRHRASRACRRRPATRCRSRHRRREAITPVRHRRTATARARASLLFSSRAGRTLRIPTAVRSHRRALTIDPSSSLPSTHYRPSLFPSHPLPYVRRTHTPTWPCHLERSPRISSFPSSSCVCLKSRLPFCISSFGRSR